MLKKLTVILLLGVHLFNVAGYKAFFQYFINTSDQQIVQRLDNERYTDAELSEIKVALNLPYLTNRKSYERVNGEVIINGVHYNYVKRRISNDTLYLQCLPNLEKTKLADAKNNYAKEASDNTTDHKSNTIKKYSPGSEYNQQLPDYSLQVPVTCVQPLFSNHSSSLVHSTLQIHTEPPEIA